MSGAVSIPTGPRITIDEKLHRITVDAPRCAPAHDNGPAPRLSEGTGPDDLWS